MTRILHRSIGGRLPQAVAGQGVFVTDNDGRITRYTLGTSDRWLSPGERFGFASRLDVPRNGVKTVSVTFAE